VFCNSWFLDAVPFGGSVLGYGGSRNSGARVLVSLRSRFELVSCGGRVWSFHVCEAVSGAFYLFIGIFLSLSETVFAALVVEYQFGCVIW